MPPSAPRSSKGWPARGRSLPPLNPERFAPTAARPVRGTARQMASRDDIQPHHHHWGQLAFAVSGVLRVHTPEAAFLAPPSRAVWVPGGVEHAVTAVERCDTRTLYLLDPPAPDWASGCRVIEVTPLLRELCRALSDLDDQPQPSRPARERGLAQLILDELRHAPGVRLGIALPNDARLRRLCEAVLADPQRHARLADWAFEVGASERTIARLFAQQLGTSYAQWRAQVLLAQALALAARGQPLHVIATELGYAHPSAFSAMVKRTVGQTPKAFFGR